MSTRTVTRWLSIGVACGALATAPTVAGSKAAVSALPQATEYKTLTFWEISGYDYNKNERFIQYPRKVVRGIPPWVRDLSGSRVSLMGTMVPLDIDQSGAVRTFILTTNSDSCGFGMPLRINEWAMVKMRDGQTTRMSDRDVLVQGTFEVREVVADGCVTGLYHMVADAVQR